LLPVMTENKQLTLYKRLHLVYFKLSTGKDQTWSSVHVGKCLGTEPNPQNSDEKATQLCHYTVLPEH
jgi:hypothetical protein